MDSQNRTARKKYHVIYKTSCLITGKYYIGMHSTDDLDDGYLGSGKRLWRSLNKYGRETHSYEILEHLHSRESLRIREHMLVTEELLGDPLCMNLALGGGHIYNTTRAAYVKGKQKDGIKRFWSSSAGLKLRERYRGDHRLVSRARRLGRGRDQRRLSRVDSEAVRVRLR